MDWFTPRLHGALDYTLGVILIALPFAFELDPGDVADWLLIAFGSAMLVFTALTNHGLSLKPAIPLVIHLCIDLVAGATLVLCPWIFGFNERVILPFLFLGMLIIFVSFLTGAERLRTKPSA